MAFIPIIAKSDVASTQKGKITPAQMAQLFAWVLRNKTGILNTLGRCEAMQTSIPVSGNSATITFKSGYLVICGRLIECTEGTPFTLTGMSEGDRGNIVARFNVGATGTTEFFVTYYKGRPLTQQDLNENPTTGIYEYSLYDYSFSGGVLTLTRSEDYIDDINTFAEDITNGNIVASTATYFNPSWTGSAYDPTQTEDENNIALFFRAIMGNGLYRNGQPTTPSRVPAVDAPLSGYDTSKGPIEARLKKMGFSEGSVSGIDGATLTRSGKYAILTLPFYHNNTLNEQSISLSMSMKSNEDYVFIGSARTDIGVGNIFELIFEKGSNVARLVVPAASTIRTNRVGFEVVVE